ncbi:hypothetical protein O9992_27020 [Vibrio lentus]|nr:hypothetical protein [Vibrio lentus]
MIARDFAVLFNLGGNATKFTNDGHVLIQARHSTNKKADCFSLLPIPGSAFER